ncbi:hypothetical protein MVES1_000532 [Malassezia vespertilionis]|uniref:uncharacterized protein n=1 Tax=Malassezia vespertilionis TaxID=2020962 RepID=UPI0024B2351F|nr:uncharacterized protein MVES1_000532 [Malassezia vespertilionis]WFD05204.1 hypothetical protein MVES1_000532 [Malassezia vespertilionis]
MSGAQLDTSQLVAYTGILSIACACVYIGSFASLHTPISTRKLRVEADQDPNEDENQSELQSLSSDGAWAFPLIGSAVLFSLFLAFKYLNKELINLLIATYFTVIGLVTIPTALQHVIVFFYDRNFVKREKKKYLELKVDCNWVDKTKPEEAQEKNGIDTKADMYTFAMLAFSVVLLGTHLYTKLWVSANTIALCFALQGITLIGLDSFTTGFILLGGLFFYDIFWVFGSTHLVGTSVMVDVATKFDAPIKILFPKNVEEIATSLLEHGLTDLPKLKFALLGLGDIVIPGVFVALALHFDQKHASESTPGLFFTRYYYKFAKPYFTACFVAYVLGLVTTITVMHVFHAAQPALLYLSPACSLSVVLVAFVRGELKELFQFSDKTIEPFSGKVEKKE